MVGTLHVEALVGVREVRARERLDERDVTGFVMRFEESRVGTGFAVAENEDGVRHATLRLGLKCTFR